MARLEVAFSRDAAKQYKQLPGEYRVLVDVAPLRLSQGSGVDLKPVVGERDVYRIRAGKYRILFKKLGNIALVFRVAPRGAAYK